MKMRGAENTMAIIQLLMWSIIIIGGVLVITGWGPIALRVLGDLAAKKGEAEKPGLGEIGKNVIIPGAGLLLSRYIMRPNKKKGTLNTEVIISVIILLVIIGVIWKIWGSSLGSFGAAVVEGLVGRAKEITTGILKGLSGG